MDPLLDALGEPPEGAILLAGVTGLVDALSLCQRDLVLVLGTNDAQLLVQFLYRTTITESQNSLKKKTKSLYMLLAFL